MHLAIAAVTLALTSSANAFWRTTCGNHVLDARVDPIVSPGKVSAHAHTIMGSNAVGLTASFDGLRNGNCTTCAVDQDKSLYWAPALYYEYPNKTYSSVPHGGAAVYYFQRFGQGETVEPFPDGLRFVSGDPYVRNYTGTDPARALTYLCLNWDKPDVPATNGFGPTLCKDGFRAQMYAPSCWDGHNLDSANHYDHMAYPSGIDNGPCPSTHPVRLVTMLLEIWYQVDQFNKLNDGGRFVLSDGDPTGFSMHFDFANGWDKNILAAAVKNCNNNSGRVEDCPAFNGHLLSADQQNSCSAVNPVPSENVDAPNLPFLPGCVAITEGPGRASPNTYAPGCTINGQAPGSGSPPSSTSSSGSTQPSKAPLRLSSPNNGTNTSMPSNWTSTSSSGWTQPSMPPTQSSVPACYPPPSSHTHSGHHSSMHSHPGSSPSPSPIADPALTSSSSSSSSSSPSSYPSPSHKLDLNPNSSSSPSYSPSPSPSSSSSPSPSPSPSTPNSNPANPSGTPFGTCGGRPQSASRRRRHHKGMERRRIH